MKFIDNLIARELFAMIIKKYNQENETKFDPYKISIASSNEIMREISSRASYTQFHKRYLYTKGHSVRTRKTDVPISMDEKDIAEFLEYLEFSSYDEFHQAAEFEIKKELPRLINIKVPKELITPIQQYLIFFKEFTSTTKGEEIDVRIAESEDGIEIMYNVPEKVNENDINKWFEEYINLLKENMDNDRFQMDNVSILRPQSKNDFELLKLKMENQIAHLKNSLRIAEVKNFMLEEKYQDIKELALSYSNQENVIKTQIITGGNQQFASNIKNLEDEN